MEGTQRLLSINEKRGFPGMLGSIDCMHGEWKTCPFAWQGQYSGHVDGCTVILEAFLGMAGAHNDINMLQRSPIFAGLAEGNAPSASYEIMGIHTPRDIKGLLQTLDRHPFRIFSMHIMRFETGKPISPSMKIW
jgi:hypothetical protein